MIDLGKINEAENILLDSIDYTNNNEVIEVALFYQLKIAKFNSTIHLYSGILFCTSGV